MVITRVLSAALLCCLNVMVMAAVELEVTPDPVIKNQSCQLSFRVTGAVDSEPDFSVLEKDFEIIGRNRQSSIGWRNGKREQSTTWVLSAIPRGDSVIRIPAIDFGQQRSAARSVTVADATPQQSSQGAEIIVEVEVDTHSPYVQQQVIYTVRMLHRVELSSPRFSALDTDNDAIIKPLGDGRQYREQRDGNNYEAYEQQFAVFAQQSGPMTILPRVLTTQIVTRKRSFFDPFSQSLQTRRVESKAITLEVQPIPASFPRDATWLPAKRIRLHDQWEPDSREADVGAPLARTLFLWADGLVAGQLPEIALIAPDGVKVYPDQAQNNDQATATGYTALMQQKFALIAGVPGSGQFAGIRLPWWNLTSDSLEYAEIEARVINFVGSIAPALDSAAAASTELPASSSSVSGEAMPGTGTPWREVAAAISLGWLLTTIAWWRSAARRRPQHQAPKRTMAQVPTGARASRDLKAACAAHDPQAARAALLQWSATLPGPGKPTQALRELADQVQSEALCHAVIQLDQVLYGRNAPDWDGSALWEAFRREPRPTASSAEKDDLALPPLLRLARK